MDIYYHRQGVDFVWHDQKAQSNIHKHDGVSFEQATGVFFDPFFIMIEASDNGQERYVVIGYDDLGKLLFVVHIEQQDDVIRIISARLATSKEKMRYEQDH